MTSRRTALAWAAGTACAAASASPARGGPHRLRAADFGKADLGALGGFNVGDVHHGDAAYFDAVAATGARLVRTTLPLGRCAGCHHFQRRPEDLRALATLLDRAAARGLKVVVVGGFEGITDATFWRDAAAQDDWVDSWRLVARECGEHPALAGLDLLNEPQPPAHASASASGLGLAAAQAQWRALATRAARAIRSAGCERPLIVEGVAGASPAGLRGLQPLDDPEVVYSLHFYLPHAITHQGLAPDWPDAQVYPGTPSQRLAGGDPRLPPGPFNIERLAQELQPAVDFQAQHGVPLYVGEFSCIRSAPGDSALRWVSDSLALFERLGWSWTYHEFRGWPGWDAELADRSATLRRPDAPVMRRLRQALAAAR